MYSYAWVKDPIVSGFILESGTVGLRSPSSTPAKAGALVEQANKEPKGMGKWYKATSKLGCGDATTSAEHNLECMKSKKWQDVLAAIKTEGAAASTASTGDFGPTADGKVVFKDYEARAREGELIKKPMLIGSNKNEAGLFIALLNSTAPAATVNSAAFGCPASLAANTRVKSKVKIWRYLYSAECE
jgi:carboxylesterase type B